MKPAGAQSIEETILAKEDAAMERWRRGDPMGWAEISAEEVTYIDPDLTEPIRGLEAYRAFLEGLVGQVEYDGSEYIEPRVAVYGELAVLSYNYVSTVLGESGEVVQRTPWNSTEVYALLDGEWKIIHTHWSFINHVPPQELEMRMPVDMGGTTYLGVLGELLSLEVAAMDRWRQGDPQGFIQLSADEVTHFNAGTRQRLNGIDAVKDLYQEVDGTVHFDAMEFIDPTVQLHGDAAVLSFRFFATSLSRDGTIGARTPWNCTEVFVRKEGEWKIVHTHQSFIRGERY